MDSQTILKSPLCVRDVRLGNVNVESVAEKRNLTRTWREREAT
jgi:hypothetical protein